MRARAIDPADLALTREQIDLPPAVPVPELHGLAGVLGYGYPPLPRPRAFLAAAAPAYVWRDAQRRIVAQRNATDPDSPVLVRAALCGMRCVKTGQPGLLPSCDSEPAWWMTISTVCPPCCTLRALPTTVLYGGPVAVRYYPDVRRILESWARTLEMPDPLGQPGVVVGRFTVETQMLPLLHNGVLVLTNPAERVYWPHMNFQWWWATEVHQPATYRVGYFQDGSAWRETLEAVT